MPVPSSNHPSSGLDLPTKVAIGALALAAFCYGAGIITSLVDQILYARLANGELLPDNELFVSDERRVKMGYVALGASLFANLGWAGWTFAYLRRVQPDRKARRFSPFWTAVSIFVPIVVLWYPFNAVWETATKDARDRPLAVPLLIWQLAMGLALVLRGISFGLLLRPTATTLEELALETWIVMGALAVQILGLWYTGTVMARLAPRPARSTEAWQPAA